MYTTSDNSLNAFMTITSLKQGCCPLVLSEIYVHVVIAVIASAGMIIPTSSPLFSTRKPRTKIQKYAPIIQGSVQCFSLTDPDSWAHQEACLAGRPDSMSAPRFGYTMERLWSTLMQCPDMRVAARWPMLLSRTRRGGSPADCQCLDRAFVP